MGYEAKMMSLRLKGCAKSWRSRSRERFCRLSVSSLGLSTFNSRQNVGDRGQKRVFSPARVPDRHAIDVVRAVAEPLDFSGTYPVQLPSRELCSPRYPSLFQRLLTRRSIFPLLVHPVAQAATVSPNGLPGSISVACGGREIPPTRRHQDGRSRKSGSSTSPRPKMFCWALLEPSPCCRGMPACVHVIAPSLHTNQITWFLILGS